MIRWTLRAIDQACAVGAHLAALAIVVMAVIGMAEIVLRSFFSYSMPFALEYGTYLLAVTMLGGAGWTLRGGGHIRISLLFEAVPAAGRALDLVSSLVALVVSGYFSWAMIEFTLQSFTSGMLSFFPSETLLAYPQLAFTLAIVVLTLGLVGRCIRLLANEPPETPPPTFAEHTML